MVRKAIRGLLGVVAMTGMFCATPLVQAEDKVGKPLASRELDVEGIVAEVIESVRKDGILTVRVRLRNTGQKAQKVLLVRGGQSYDAAYLSARDTKYTLVKDTSQRVVATPADTAR